MSQELDLLCTSFNRHRLRLFGDCSLKLYEVTPLAGETEVFAFIDGWKGHRLQGTTDGDRESGSWQFQIIADENWQTVELATFKKVVALTVDGRRWAVRKVEEPIGNSLVWKLRAEIEK